MVPTVEKENLPLTGRNLERSLWEERREEERDHWPRVTRVAEPTRTSRQILRTISQQSSDDISALQNPVVPSPTEQELFISLIWCLPGSSRADEDNVTAPNTEHQYSGGQPPPQIPSKFIHLCFPKWAHPHISDHNKALQSEDFFAPFFARSDAFMRGTVVYRMTSRQCDVADSSDVEDRVWSGARGSEIVAAFFSYLFHLFGTENCRTQKSGILWDWASKDFCHCWQAVAVVIQLQSVSVLSSSCRWDPGESVDPLSSKPGLLLHGKQRTTLSSAARSAPSGGVTALHKYCR